MFVGEIFLRKDMIMSKRVKTKNKRAKRPWLIGAGKAMVVFTVIFGLAACYPMQERVIVQPASAGARTQRPSLTQVYFYPNKRQSIEQQSRDHYECYNWAIKQTGFDPSASPLPPEQRVRVVPMPSPGYNTAAFAVAGAVLGALLGGPRHAAGGALIGAAGGAIAGAATDTARQESARQHEEAYARRNEALNAQFEQKELDFRRAMGACLEGRGYTVK
jgi:hypothetical protein